MRRRGRGRWEKGKEMTNLVQGAVGQVTLLLSDFEFSVTREEDLWYCSEYCGR